MRSILICASSLALMAGVAFADELKVEVPVPGIAVEHRSADVDKRVVTHDEDGCKTKTVKKTDGDGDTSVKTKTNC
jgi:hypothetical protein